MAIGPKGSKVGFGTVNKYFKNLFTYNKTIYKVTEILGLIALLIVAVYGLVGLVQLIKRKSLFKVDKRIYILGVFYVLVGIIYFFFDKVAMCKVRDICSKPGKVTSTAHRFDFV